MASSPGFFTPFLEALRDLLALKRAEKLEAIIIGGLATAILGRPRITRDVDCLVWLEESRWASFLVTTARFHFKPRLKDPLSFARQSRVLLLRHTPSSVEIDVAFAALPFEREVFARSIVKKVNGLQIPLPSVEDLIIMKAIAHRPRDLSDAEGLLDSHSNLNRRRIRRVVQEFSTLLENPDLATDLEVLLGRVRRKGKRS